MPIASVMIAMALQGVTLESRIVRAAAAGEDVAAYVAIANPGGEDRLIGASCDCAERVEIHQMVRDADGDGMTMETAATLAVPAGGVEIRPGSALHLMLVRLNAALSEGQRVAITLRFERAGAVTGEFVAVGDTRAAWAGAARPTAPPLAAELEPLFFLVGSCWRATFPGTTHTDTHCYTAMLGGRYVRDRHVVEGAPSPYSGETVYRWDPEARRIRYEYYASDGGYSAGTAEPTQTGLNFPEEAYVGADGRRLTLRNGLIREGQGYSATSAMRQSETWREMWTMRFERVGDAPAD